MKHFFTGGWNDDLKVSILQLCTAILVILVIVTQ